MDVVAVVTFNVWVDNRHHLTPLGGHIVDHVLWVLELVGIPGEVAV